VLALVPQSLSRVFYSDDGSTAVEVALKMVLQYWANNGEPQRDRIIALEHAYHGDTVGAMSVSAPSPFTQPFERIIFPVTRVASAYCYRCPVGLTRERCDIDCLGQLEAALRTHNEHTAAVIVEPLLQGAGGMIVHPIEFLQRVRALCDRFAVLLIADEVLTGFGRTGTMFACEQARIVPDILCLSKGITGGFLPLGATLCSERIHEAFLSEDRQRTFFHGHSYTANPLACAAALASLDVFNAEPVFERIASITDYHRQRLERLRGHPRVGDCRQIGTVAAIELRDGDAGYLSSIGPKLQRYYLEHGVVLRPLGPVVYVLPPYCTSPESLAYAWDTVEASLSVA
jgi:adenosylmethionine-8-amino-7-oxononanoate aminotransferase